MTFIQLPYFVQNTVPGSSNALNKLTVFKRVIGIWMTAQINSTSTEQLLSTQISYHISLANSSINISQFHLSQVVILVIAFPLANNICGFISPDFFTSANLFLPVLQYYWNRHNFLFLLLFILCYLLFLFLKNNPYHLFYLITTKCYCFKSNPGFIISSVLFISLHFFTKSSIFLLLHLYYCSFS